MESITARSAHSWAKPLPSRSWRRRIRRQLLGASGSFTAALPLAEQTGDASNGDGDAGLRRTLAELREE